MATLVCFHAHPDDEAIDDRRHDGPGQAPRATASCSSSPRTASTARCPTTSRDGETLVDRRRAETEALGRGARRRPGRVARLPRLGDDRLGAERRPGVVPPGRRRRGGRAAGRRSCEEEHADVLTIYDWHGNYGHPDHIQVHQVGHRAAELAGTPRVFEATMNRDAIVRMMEEHRGTDELFGEAAEDFDPDGPADDGNPFGMPEAEITLAVDVDAYVGRKRAAICRPPQPGHRHRDSSWRCPRRSSGPPSAPSGSSSRASRAPALDRAGSSPDRRPPVPRPPRPRRRRLGRRSRPSPRRRRPRAGRRGGRAAGRDARPARPGRRQPAAALPADRRAHRRAMGRRRGRSSRWWPRSRRPRASRWGSGWRGCARRWPAGGATSARATSTSATRSWPDSLAATGAGGRRQPLRRHQRGDRGRARRRPDGAAVARQLLGHRPRRGRRRAAPGRGRARGRHAHPLTGPGWRRDRADAGARPTPRSACGSARGPSPSCRSCCGSWASGGSCS